MHRADWHRILKLLECLEEHFRDQSQDGKRKFFGAQRAPRAHSSEMGHWKRGQVIVHEGKTKQREVKGTCKIDGRWVPSGHGTCRTIVQTGTDVAIAVQMMLHASDADDALTGMATSILPRTKLSA